MKDNKTLRSAINENISIKIAAKKSAKSSISAALKKFPSTMERLKTS